MLQSQYLDKEALMVDCQENNQIIYVATFYFPHICAHTMLYIQPMQNVEIILHYNQKIDLIDDLSTNNYIKYIFIIQTFPNVLIKWDVLFLKVQIYKIILDLLSPLSSP